MKIVGPLWAVTLPLMWAAANWAPPTWKWPALGALGFVAVFVTTRIVARSLGEAAEERFNRR